MRMRVEELAAQADVSVDTVRFYQKQQLLSPPERDGRVAWYSEEHLERLARIKDLQRRGFTLAVIRRFLAGELDPADEQLAAAVAGAEGGGSEELLDVEGLSARVGLPGALVESLVREGLLVPRRTDDEGERFSAEDVETLGAGLKLVEAGLPMPELIELARRHHAMTREVASQAVELFDTYVRKPLRSAGLDDDVRAQRLVEAFGTLMPAVTTVVANHFRRVLLAVAQEHLEATGDEAEIEHMRSAGSEGVWPG